MLDTFLSLYSTDSPSWSNLTSLAGDLGWTDLIARSSAEFLDLEGISRKFSREVIEAATRVNYGQVTCSYCILMRSYLTVLFSSRTWMRFTLWKVSAQWQQPVHPVSRAATSRSSNTSWLALGLIYDSTHK